MYDSAMAAVTPKEVRDYLAGLAEANAFEIEELRNASIELKLHQLWSLMTSADLFESESARETRVREVRERWARLHHALGD